MMMKMENYDGLLKAIRETYPLPKEIVESCNLHA